MNRATVPLQPGMHQLELSYFEAKDVARVSFDASPKQILASCSVPATGLTP